MLPNDRYTYRVTWSEEDNEYVGLCVEFPSLSWLEPSPEAALKGIRQVVASVVADLEADGEPVPIRSPPKSTAASSWCVFRRSYIAVWRSKRRKMASA